MQEPKSIPSSSSSVIPSSTSVEIHKDDNKVEGVVVGGRERLKRHREEIAGHVRIPEKWGHEKMMKNWIHGFSSTTFHGDDEDAFMAPPHTIILAARDALVADSRKARSQRLRIHTTC